MIDLHTHSTASDGTFSPAALMDEAAKRGLSAIALTDHDTLDGIDEARKRAASRGIRFIPGIEIEIDRGDSPDRPKGEFHLLGLGIENPGKGFFEAVETLARLREQRNREILDRMEEQGIQASLEDIAALAGSRFIGRPHFAAYLVNRKLAKDMEQAFSRYLGAGRPLYVPRRGLPFAEAAAMIRAAGGLPVLAHPLSLYIAWGRLPGFVADLRDQGLAGIEAWHPAAREGECRRLEKLGNDLGLYITAGSDFHGEIRKDRKLGITSGGHKIDEEILERIPPLFPKGR